MQPNWMQKHCLFNTALSYVHKNHIWNNKHTTTCARHVLSIKQLSRLYSIYLHLATEFHITSSSIIISWSVQNIFDYTKSRIYLIALNPEYIWLQKVQNIFDCKKSRIYLIALSPEYIWLQKVQNIFDCAKSRIYLIAQSPEYIWLHKVQNIFDCTKSRIYFIAPWAKKFWGACNTLNVAECNSTQYINSYQHLIKTEFARLFCAGAGQSSKPITSHVV